ncbi:MULTISPECIES: hypothetical protein [Faecalicoccus]|nr:MULTISPECIES: hypothetical protein [Faecalicoccus]MDB7985542.1 hypothetical protein [Faecalicoccus pleomorphus]
MLFVAVVILAILILFILWLWLSSIRDEIRKTIQLLEALLQESKKTS